MNTIRNYLDNMFLGLPNTEEVVKAKMELLEMMEDKYNELKDSGKTENEAIGVVISEFGNLEELAETLGIKHALANKQDVLHITYDEAKKYIEEKNAIAPKTALGVFLCIMSPVLLLLLIGISELNIVDIKEDLFIAVGLAALIGLIAIGISYFIRFSSKLEKYEFLEEDVFEIDYKTEQMVKGIMLEDEHSSKSAISISVVAYILSVLPLILTPLIFDIDGLSVISVAVTLTIIAFSTYNIIAKTAVNSACNVLLQKGDYSVKNKSNKTLQIITRVYWLVITAIYLAYSFITFNWGRSWIIWPVSGVIFAAIKIIAENRK